MIVDNRFIMSLLDKKKLWQYLTNMGNNSSILLSRLSEHKCLSTAYVMMNRQLNEKKLTSFGIFCYA